MANRSLPPIIHLIGPQGSGKTTLCRLFLNALAEQSVLAVDASPDNYLSLSYGEHHMPSIADVLSKAAGQSLSHEAIDWALQDLPVAVAEASDAEVLHWGLVPQDMTSAQKELLSYGLPRLFSHYDVVIWDGPMGGVQSLLPQTVIHPVVVITPQDEDFCRELTLPNAAVLLSKANRTDALPDSVWQQVSAGHWRLMGKLPPLNAAEQRARELPTYFQECFHKFDLPIDIRPNAKE